MSSSPEKTLIIGAGIAGIAAAIRLAVKGYQVEVYEANAYAGGKLAELKMDGYRFDAGPSLFTMPQYVDELFTLAGKKREDYLQYRQLDVICTYFYEDGTRIKSFADEEKMTREMTMRTGESPDAIRKHTNYSRRIYQITNPVFLQKSLHRAKTYLSTQTALSFLQLFRIDAFRSMHKANKHFFGKRQIVQYFDRYATYNGSNPYEAPATLNVIPHLEQQYGAWFPSGGMYNIITSLVKLAEETGVKFHYNIPIDEIILSGRKVTGVKVNGKMIEAGRVISNADVHFTFVPANNQPYPGRDVFVGGEFTGYQADDDARMEYNPEKGAYEKTLRLKQGYYSYTYFTKPAGNDAAKPDAALPEGSQRPWQKPHLPNLTGTPESYRPPGHDYQGGHRAPATGDYEAWTPGT